LPLDKKNRKGQGKSGKKTAKDRVKVATFQGFDL
jgi:hypothetical protein